MLSSTIYVCICLLFVLFSGNNVYVQVVWWQKTDSNFIISFTFGSNAINRRRVCQCMYVWLAGWMDGWMYKCIYTYSEVYIFTRILSLVLGILYIVFVWIGCMMLTSYFHTHLNMMRPQKKLLGNRIGEVYWGVVDRLSIWPTSLRWTESDLNIRMLPHVYQLPPGCWY